MKLGVFLSLGDNLENQKKTGQFERFFESYIKKYRQNFDSVFIFSYGQDNDFKTEKKFNLVPNKFSLPRFLYTFLLSFLEKANFNKVSIFRVMQTTGAIPAILAKFFYQIPFVTTYGFKYHQFAKIEGKIFTAYFLKILEFITLKIADGVIVTTDELKEYVREFTSAEKIFLIPNGVDTRLFKPAKKKFQRQRIKIISVGRLEKQKNYNNLIQAILASKYYPFITLTLVGGGRLKKQLKNLAKKLEVKLKIIDFVPHSMIPKILADSDIFILPSLIEGHPKVLIEAMACGLPTIASNVWGNREVIRDGVNGVLCETNSGDIAKKLDMVIEDGLLRKNLSKEGRESVLANFDIDKLIEKEISILKELSK